MYLKNTSSTAAVVLNTVVGKVGINPGEVIDLKYKILPPVSRSLIQISQEEYMALTSPKDIIKEVIEMKEDEEKLEELEKEPETVVEPPTDKEENEQKEEEALEIQDQGVMNLVNALFNQKPVDPLKVQETDSTDEISNIEQQIKDLRDSWKSTNSPRKKERIQKDIKELQKRLNKLKK